MIFFPPQLVFKNNIFEGCDGRHTAENEDNNQHKNALGRLIPYRELFNISIKYKIYGFIP